MRADYLDMISPRMQDEPENLIQEIIGVDAAAVEVVKFVKSHDYPEIFSQEMIEFTILLDRLETELRRKGLVDNNIHRGWK